MKDDRSLDDKISDNYKDKLKALREAEARKNDPGASTNGGGASNEEGRSRNAAYEKAKKEYDMAQHLLNERNARNRGNS